MDGKISKMLLFIVLFGVFFGANLPYEKIDVNLSPFVYQFDAKVESKCNKLQYYRPMKRTIIFHELNYPIIGLCTNTLLYYKIQVNPEWWATANDDDRYQLIAHESTHCMFFEGHTEDPTNYMAAIYAYIPKIELDKQVDNMIAKHCQ